MVKSREDMPSWNIHLEVGKRLAKKLNFSEKKRKEFLLGCLLPDINNGYINNPKITKSHEVTHYNDGPEGPLNFYRDYQKAINQKDPISFGYLFHLYTDRFLNNSFYSEIKHSPISKDLKYAEQRKIKHHDLHIYDLNFCHRLGIGSLGEAKRFAAEANKISVIEIMPEDILDVEHILASKELNQNSAKSQYLFYTKEKLDNLLDDMIRNFSKNYLGENHA